MRLNNKTTPEQQKQARLKIQLIFFWKDRINIKKQLLWTQTANYIPVFLDSTLSLNVKESSHY